MTDRNRNRNRSRYSSRNRNRGRIRDSRAEIDGDRDRARQRQSETEGVRKRPNLRLDCPVQIPVRRKLPPGSRSGASGGPRRRGGLVSGVRN